jgi:prophage tail gpP-like protein
LSTSLDEVSLTIGGFPIVGWTDLSVERSIDTYSTVSVLAPFDPTRSEIRELFRPFEYRDLVVEIGGERIFTGITVDIVPSFDNDSSTVSVTGYALPGQLEDCMEPQTANPLTFQDVKLRAVATALLRPFGLGFELRGEEGAKIEKLKLEPTDSPQDLLTKVAQQRGFVLTDTSDGKVLCWKSIESGSPVADFEEDVPPVGAAEAKFTAREYYSEVTGYAHAKRGRKGTHHTERNPWVYRLRPHSFELDASEPSDTKTATKTKLGRMFGNMAAWTIKDIPTWRDPSGQLWKPNTTVTLLAPHAMVYQRTELLIRDVHLKADGSKQTASLDLVMLGAFSGVAPKVLPWAE